MGYYFEGAHAASILAGLISFWSWALSFIHAFVYKSPVSIGHLFFTRKTIPSELFYSNILGLTLVRRRIKGNFSGYTIISQLSMPIPRPLHKREGEG